MLSIAEQGSGLRSISWRNFLLAFCAVFAFVAPSTVEAAQKNVLVLSQGRGRDSINRMESSLRAHFSEPVNFSIVDLDNPRFGQKAYQDNLAEALQAAYSSEKLELVVAVMTEPLQFALQYRDKLFPGVPIVFMSNSLLIPDKMWPGVTGVESTMGVRETIDLALRLQPDTETIAIIGNTSTNDSYWVPEEHSELLRHQDKLKEIDLLGPPSPELIQRVAKLPPHTVVLYQLFPQDSDQPAFGALDVLAAIAPRMPIYSILPPYVGGGAIGSVSYDPIPDAVLTGQLAARVLSGERPDDIPAVQNSDPVITVDWRQLRRWNIPESSLPPGTRVLFREPSLWEQGRKYFLAGIAVIVVQSLLIFGLLWQRTRRRKAEIELRKSEQRFSKTFRRGPLPKIVVRASDGLYVDVNEAFELHTGWKREEVIGRSPLEINLWVDTDRITAFMKELSANGNVKDFEFRFRRKDGQIRTGLRSAELIELNGEQCALSEIADITERKQAEEAMATVGSRLIEAQEAERTRIARELHDDINQRLALVAVTLDSTKQALPASDIATSHQLEAAKEQICELGSDIQALSHRLHSSRLEYLGLESAASGFCSEMSERHNVNVDFYFRDVPKGLSAQTSLCLFRVLQEALHNAVKYSGVDEFDVSFTCASGDIELRVYDAGVGFDPKETIKGHGLGLISMKERLKLVSGELWIDSEPGHGTTVLARVPLGCGEGETGHSGGKSLDLTDLGLRISA
jgi:PAS domain S-box-containing protein